MSPQSSDSDYDVLESFSDDDGATVAQQRTEGTKDSRDWSGHEEGQKYTTLVLADDDQQKPDTSSELKKLLRRREELERSNKMQEKRHERYQVSGQAVECGWVREGRRFRRKIV